MNIPASSTEKISLSGSEYLGILLHRATGNRNLLRLFGGAGNTGWIVRGGAVENWKILGLAERNGGYYLYGSPLVEAVPFSESFSFTDEKTGLLRLAVLANALSVLESKGISFNRLFPEGIFFLPEGGLLFLPESVMEKALLVRPEAERLAGFEIYNHPDLTGKENLSFACGCLAHRILTGEYPYRGETEETLHADMREKAPLSPRHRKPEIKSEVSDFIFKTLVSRDGRPSAGEWAEEIRRWIRSGWSEPATEEEKQRLLLEARRLQKKSSADHRYREFWRKNRVRTIITASIILIAAYFIGGIVSNLLKPRLTRGYSPSQVVELFYGSINTFDHAAMEDCVIGEAGKSYIREATHLFVISRMRLSVEMTEGFVNAAEWDRAGRPPVPSGKTLYGITGLTLREAAESVGAVFTVSFERWAPEAGLPEENVRERAPPKSTGSKIMEKVYLKQDKKDWVIFRIDRISETRLPVSPENANPRR
jgi:hypothetical protein